MAEFRDDDDIHRARYVYLGPPGFPMPIQLTYAQWGLFISLAGGLVLLLVPILGPLWGVGVGVGAAIPATSWVWTHVDADRPVRKVLATLATDWRQTRPPTGNQALPTLTGRHVRHHPGGPR